MDDCYFCISNVKGFNAKNKNQLVYPDLESARKPVEHGPRVPVLVLPYNIKIINSDQRLMRNLRIVIGQTILNLSHKMN